MGEESQCSGSAHLLLVPFRPLHCADTVPLPGRYTALLHTAYCQCCARLLLQAGAPTGLYLGQLLPASVGLPGFTFSGYRTPRSQAL